MYALGITEKQILGQRAFVMVSNNRKCKLNRIRAQDPNKWAFFGTPDPCNPINLLSISHPHPACLLLLSTNLRGNYQRLKSTSIYSQLSTSSEEYQYHSTNELLFRTRLQEPISSTCGVFCRPIQLENNLDSLLINLIRHRHPSTHSSSYHLFVVDRWQWNQRTDRATSFSTSSVLCKFSWWSAKSDITIPISTN